MIVDSLDNEKLLRASRKLKRAKVVNSYGLNIYDLLYHEKLVLSRAAALELAELLDPQAKKAGERVEESAEENEGAANNTAQGEEEATEEAA